MEYKLLPHQAALIGSIHKYPDITYTFDVAGFGSGKSFADVVLLLSLVSWYNGHYLTFGIGGAAIKHLRETVIKDFTQIMDQHKIKYHHNSQTSIITVGTITFVYFSLDMPESIFGYNFAGALLDEVDEIAEADRVRVSTIAVQERCRIRLPPTNNGYTARSPFITITTTAQGMRGLYMLQAFLKDAGIPYVSIRGRTRDNTNLDPQTIENLYKMYTPDEAKAYLDGEFINLTTGRVYPEYNPAIHNCMAFPVKDDDILYVGQDFNPGFNMSAVCIVRGQTVWVIAEHHWEVVGDAPRRLRQIYPNNKIVMIPDVSGKELMQAYIAEFDAYAIDRVWSTVNPSVTDRIMAVNKLLRDGRLKVFSTAAKVNRALQLRDFDDKGNPRKSKGPEALDHPADSLEYAIWHIVHSVTGFEELLQVIRTRHERHWPDQA